MEEMHKKLISDLQRQHQKEVAKLLREKDQLLKEETAATMAGKLCTVTVIYIFDILHVHRNVLLISKTQSCSYCSYEESS